MGCVLKKNNDGKSTVFDQEYLDQLDKSKHLLLIQTNFFEWKKIWILTVKLCFTWLIFEIDSLEIQDRWLVLIMSLL